MQLSPTDLIILSRLLDEAMDLAPEQVGAWLAGLPPEHEHLRTRLEEMLTAHHQSSNPGFMAEGPKLAEAPDETVARTGDLVGPYRLIREIGRGGMGAVWLAERADGMLKRQVALKLPRLAWGAGLAERMARERDIGALLEHPNIARLYDAGVDSKGRPYLALEYIDGQPLDAWCEAQALSVRERLRLFVPVARAVAYAHGRLVVHRDLKPSNVLITADGQVHLLDFGIAKLLHESGAGNDQLTQEQGRVLTPHYASPEQIRGETITVGSDVYSLGVLLYELLTWRYPYSPGRKSLAAIEEAIANDEPPLASSRAADKQVARQLRGEIDAILAKALRREPNQRYATADAFAEDIERHLKGDAVLARPDSFGYRAAKTLRRHWVGVSASVAVLLAILTGSAVAVMQAQRAARSAERERVVKEFVADVFRVNSRVNPKNATMRPASSQALLEGGAELIQSRFAGQPDIQAELFGVVGGVFYQMGAYRLAAEYSTRQIETLALLRASDQDQAVALLALASALFGEGRVNDAEPRITRILQLSTSEELLKLNAMIILARIQSVRGDYAQERTTLDVVEKRLHARGPAPSVAMGWIVFLRGELLALENHLDEAIPLYQRGIDIARAAEGEFDPDVIQMGLGAAQSMAKTSHAKEAQRFFDAAVSALRKLGGAYEVRASLATARFAYTMFAEGGHGTYSDTVSQIEQSRLQLTQTGLPVPSWYLSRVQFWAGSLLGQAGDIEGAVPLLEASAPELQRIVETPLRTMELAIPMSHVLLHAGRYEAAQQWASRLLEARHQFGGESHPYAVWDHILEGQILNMQGRSSEALARLDAAPAFEPFRGDGSDMNRFNKYLAQARAAFTLELGDASGALELLRAVDHGENDADEFLMSYDTLLGQALCQSKRRIEGLRLLKQRIDAAETDFAYAPWRARLLSLTGLCAVGAGDRRWAATLAGQARAVIARQPAVSSYYKKPLLELEQALKIR